MLIKFLIFILALATGLIATPLRTRSNVAPDLGNGYAELYSEQASTGDGQLIYYGLSGSGNTTSPSEQSGAVEHVTCTLYGNVVCDRNNAARNDVCDTLIQELQLDYTVSVGQSPRQICYLGVSTTNSFCCVSWHNPIPGLIKGDLFDIANTSKQPFLTLSYKICRGRALTPSSIHTVHC
jgi:hypothetical protein